MSTRIVEYNRLPRSVRERFVECTSGLSSGTTQPILADRLSKGTAALGWGSLAACGAGVVLMLWKVGFGDVYSRSAGVQGAGYLLLWALGLFTLGYSVLAIFKRRSLLRALPFPPGRYLFALDFVDARTGTLRVVPMGSLLDFRGVHHYTNGAYTHTELTFRFEGSGNESFVVRGREQAELVLQELRHSQQLVRQAVEDRDAVRLFALDPFFEARVGDAWDKPADAFQTVEGPLAKRQPALLERALVVSAAAAVLLAAPAWWVRNRVSDEAMFASAARHQDAYMLERYLEIGGRHAAEVRSDLLPRAALKEAQKKGSVTELRAFLKKYPGSVVEADARAAIHTLFVKTVDEFRRQASTTDAALLPFMDTLFTYLEAHDSPPVRVQFKKPSSSSLTTADLLLTKVVEGEVAPIAPHFDDKRALPREAAIVNVLSSAFSSIFPADVMRLEQTPKGETLPASEGENPSFDIAYEVSWSGSIYESEKRARKFVGIKVAFDVAMHIPGELQTYQFPLVVEPPERFTVESTVLPGLGVGIDALDTDAAAPSDGKVYDVMAIRAFDELATKLRTVFFRPGTKAFEGATGQPARKTRLPDLDLPDLSDLPDVSDLPPPLPKGTGSARRKGQSL